MMVLGHRPFLSANLCISKTAENTKPIIVFLQVNYSVRRLTGLQAQNLYVGPQRDPDPSDALALRSVFRGVEPKPDPIKGGLRVSSYFTYNCLSVRVSFFSSDWLPT